MAFSVARILLALVTVSVLFAGTLQGTISYADYCKDHGDHNDDIDDSNVLEYVLDYNKKWCDFSSNGKYNDDVDFVAVVALSGIGALLWVSS